MGQIARVRDLSEAAGLTERARDKLPANLNKQIDPSDMETAMTTG